MKLGENIRRAREAKGYQQGELARMVGITEQMMCYIEKGGKVPGLPLFALIAKTLGVSMDSLYND